MYSNFSSQPILKHFQFDNDVIYLSIFPIILAALIIIARLVLALGGSIL
jgi:hypothetical protein